MTAAFPRTLVGGVSLSRLVIGTNWFLGYSHTSAARDAAIKKSHNRQSIAEILQVFLQSGVDTVLGPPHPLLAEALDEAEQRAGRRLIRLLTPSFKVLPGGADLVDAERAVAECRELGAQFCLPHQQVTDALLDRSARQVRSLPELSALIRRCGMVPGLSTHLPEALVFADENAYDVETCLQIYNAAGFMMPIEVDWQLRLIQEAKKPVIAIKPLAAGRLIPLVGLCFAWNTLRECDLVAVGTTSPEEAREVIDLSLGFIEKRSPALPLQSTRSKEVFRQG